MPRTSSTLPKTSPSGTSTAPQPARLPATTPTSTCALAPSTPIPSAVHPTSSSSPSAGTPTAHPTSTTSAMSAPRSWRPTPNASPGSVLSRSTLSSVRMTGLTAGPLAATLLRTSFIPRDKHVLTKSPRIRANLSYSQGPYYCGVGAGKVVLRHVVDAHYKACLCKLTQFDTIHSLNNG